MDKQNTAPNPEEVAIEWGGSGEKIELEYTLNASLERLTQAWQASPVTQARMEQSAGPLQLSFCYSMSDEPGDWSHVSVQFEKLSDQASRLKIIHSFLLDDDECNRFKGIWNNRINQLVSELS